MALKAIGELFIRQDHGGHVALIIAREARECKSADVNNKFDREVAVTSICVF